MSIRTTIANTLIGVGRSIGYKKGQSELAVTLSGHSINARMVETDSDSIAWDSDLYHRGNVFYQDYANPIKVRVDTNPELENPDTAEIEHTGENTEKDGDSKAELMSSNRYRTFMKQSVIADMLNPSEHIRLIVYAIIALAVLMAANFVATLSAAGAF